MAVLASMVAGASPAAAALVYQTGFEAPLYVPGPIQGQDGWLGDAGYPMVTTDRAHSGTQSLRTTANAGPGRPFPAPFAIHAMPAWWMETWVYVESTTGLTSSSFSARSSLGTAFYISIAGDGTTWLNTGSEQSIRSLGTSVLDRWVKLRIEKTAPLTLRLSVTGAGLDESFQGRFQTPWDPQQIAVGTGHAGPVTGSAYWDDIRVSDTGDEGPAVPEPGTALLLGAGLTAAASRLRRRPSTS